MASLGSKLRDHVDDVIVWLIHFTESTNRDRNRATRHKVLH